VARLVLKPGMDRRLRAGHPWVYRGEIADLVGRSIPGDTVEVLDGGGHFLGRGFYNPRPSLACRLLTTIDEPIDEGFFHRRLTAALDYRRSAGLLSDAYRLCWSESDGLPGLVVDRYGPVSVIQCLTLGMTRAEPWVIASLASLFPGEAAYRTDDATAARIEGFVAEQGWRGDAGPTDLVITEGACRLVVVIGAGQKTGLYLDQRQNHTLVAARAEGRRVLDAFSYTGAFAGHALLGGASSALLLESSTDALTLAQRNLELNGGAERAELHEANAFDALRSLESSGERFGLIVLDPPPFTRRKDTVDSAARGYKEINLRAARLLESGGILATFSCSHHIGPGLFETICRDAIGDARVPMRVLQSLTQSADHPVRLAVPETRYLTGLFLERL
jgi:23S rRNA (cytosine1962-C5)-methyltransferase